LNEKLAAKEKQGYPATVPGIAPEKPSGKFNGRVSMVFHTGWQASRGRAKHCYAK